MAPRFAFPWALLLLALVPWSIYVGAKIRSLSPGRKWTAIALRSIIIALLVMALAGIEIIRKQDRLAVFFLLDRSNSIPHETREAALQWVRDTCKNFMTSKDEAGLIVFGEESIIELTVAPGLQLDKVRSFIGGEQTDIASALRLAMAAFPQGYMRRIVLLTDGNETRGSAIEEARIAQSAGAAVDVLPLFVGGGDETRIKEVAAASHARADEPFQLRVVIHSTRDTGGTLRIFRRLKEGRSLLGERRVSLQPGDNVFLLTQELNDPGFYEYEATIEAEADTVAANNEGRTYTVVRGEPAVLYMDGDRGKGEFLERALAEEGLNVVRIDPGGTPASLAQLENYDVFVLSNVSAVELTMDQMRSIEAMVRDLGIGLVMIGGPESFGAGGYFDTPVERALPVDMDIKQRKILPRGALVLVMHTCEIPQGNMWAREIGLASLNVLASQDLMGALGYMWGQGTNGDTWIYKLQPVGDKSMMRATLTQAATRIGDMPDVSPTVEMGYKALVNADAAVKRMVVISDGDPAAPQAGLLKKIAAAKISISTVCIAPHSPSDQNMLKGMAESTGGRFYFVNNPNNLPQIFTKEAAEVKRGILFEEPFTPRVNHYSELLIGLSGRSLPKLYGYVITTPKEKATIPLVSPEKDPVLAHWRYGLGKSVAFTSDATARWARDWIAWDGFNRFWAQTVRWAMREVTPTNFTVATSIRNSRGHVKIDAVDKEGRFVNYLQPRGVVTGPPPDFERTELGLVQTGPGIYEADFPIGDPGVYMVNVVYNREDGSTGMIPAGLSMNYSREYEYTTTNRNMLENLAAAGGGIVLETTANPFVHDLVATPSVTPIWQWLAVIAICLLPIEVFVRRVVFDLRTLRLWIARGLKVLPGIGALIKIPETRPAPVTGVYYSSQPATGEGPRAVAEPTFGVKVERIAAAEEKKAVDTKKKQDEKKTDDGTDYTRRLLEAKKRATKRHRRATRYGGDGDKENS